MNTHPTTHTARAAALAAGLADLCQAHGVSLFFQVNPAALWMDGIHWGFIDHASEGSAGQAFAVRAGGPEPRAAGPAPAYVSPSANALDLLGRALEYVESYGAIMDTEASRPDREDLAHAIRNALHAATLAEGEDLSAGEGDAVRDQLVAALRETSDLLENYAGQAEAANEHCVIEALRQARHAIATAELERLASPTTPTTCPDECTLPAGGAVWLTVGRLSVKVREVDGSAQVKIYPLDGEDGNPLAACEASNDDAHDQTAAALRAELLTYTDGDEERLIEVLDDMTHEAQIANASDVNNQGTEAQIAALLAAGVTADTIRERLNA